MSQMINFGIDLGTTNSLIAKFNKGTVEVFKNPIGFTETLPSVVGFRKESILIGDKAKGYTEKDPKNVKGCFKRKMGTAESFKIETLGQSKTPIELSAFVLKELKRFIHTGESPESVVITVPASFDMLQANATKEAGYKAGFKQVVLLQEPIAASLAYANKEKNIDLKNSQWIVYDLGGGTFDVALVKIIEGELKIVDHEGDNYLGGSDFDAMIVEKIIVPHLEKRGTFTDLLPQMKSETGRYNRLWYSLLHKAEEAKKELSALSSADIDLSRSNIEDENGKEIDDIVVVTRSEYENLIKDEIDRTAEMLKKILTRNSLRPNDLKFVLMVGGATYTPFVRKRIEELLGISVNTGIDPTNAIVIGAAYFAATKEVNLNETATERPVKQGVRKVKVSYNRASKELEEIFAARIEGTVDGLFYRIIREDGGYDSGLKKLSSRITEDLPLKEEAYNIFTFRIYDTQNNPVASDIDTIQIAQGIYNVAGQMLPHDLSLVKDNLDAGDIALVPIFKKNTVLPAKTKMTAEVNKTITRGSSDDVIRIIVVEGPSENHPSANKKLGELFISGKQIGRDLHRGSEIDLSFELSESRDLSVNAYINPSGPEFSGIFTSKYTTVDTDVLAEEVQLLEERLEEEKEEALASENYEAVDRLESLSRTVKELHGETMILSLTPDDATDNRYKLDERKRKVAEEVGRLTAGKQIEQLRSEYQTVKSETTDLVNESGNDLERRRLHEIVTREYTFINSTSPQKIETEIIHLRQLSYCILRRTPSFLMGWFQHLTGKRETFNDQIQAKNLIEAGKKHIESEDYDKLAEVNVRLHDLLPQQEQNSKEMRHFTRIDVRH